MTYEAQIWICRMGDETGWHVVRASEDRHRCDLCEGPFLPLDAVKGVVEALETALHLMDSSQWRSSTTVELAYQKIVDALQALPDELKEPSDG